MKTAVYFLFLTLIQLKSYRAYTQSIRDFGNIPFGDCLSKWDNQELIKKLRVDFDSAIFRFNVNQKKMPFNFKDKWKLVYYTHTGYEEIVGRPKIEISKIYKNNQQEKWLTVAEIFNEFKICDTLPDNVYSKESYLENTFPINRYLDISDKFRGIWTPIVSEDHYLIIYFHHWYPNGNAQSWLREFFYYFEKN